MLFFVFPEDSMRTGAQELSVSAATICQTFLLSAWLDRQLLSKLVKQLELLWCVG